MWNVKETICQWRKPIVESEGKGELMQTNFSFLSSKQMNMENVLNVDVNRLISVDQHQHLMQS